MSPGPENASPGGLLGWLARRRESRRHDQRRGQLDAAYQAALERLDVTCEGLVDQIERRREAKHAEQAAALALQQAGTPDDSPALQAHVAAITRLDDEMNAVRETMAPLLGEKERLENDRRVALTALESGASLEALLAEAATHAARGRERMEAALRASR